MKQFLKYKYIIILLILTFFAVEPLLHPGFPPTHDGEYHVIRFYEFDNTLRDGSIYPRWASDLNNRHGLPLFNYVYPLPNYFGSLFHVFGMSFIDSFKMSLFAATVIGVLFFYFWLRIFFIPLAALTGAIFYAFAPYRFVDIYVRGSVGEIWALAWFPAFLWAVTLFFRKREVSYMILASIFLALTIFSHNILALMFFLFGTTYAVLLTWQSKRRTFFVLSSLFIVIAAIALSAVFWLPALVETKYVQGLQIYDIKAHFPELYQLLIPSWGTGFSGGSVEGQMSFQIGIANLLAVFAGFILFLKRIKEKREVKKLLGYFLLWFVAVFFLMLSASKSLWETIPLLNYFQFPWRFLSLMILICAFIAGAVVALIERKNLREIISVFFIAFAILSAYSYTKPAYYHDRTDRHYLTRNNFIHGTNSPGNVFNTIWMNKVPALKTKEVDIVQGKADIDIRESKSTKLLFSIKSKEAATIVVHRTYFPGWKAIVDGREVTLDKRKEGTMAVAVPEGDHTVELHFGDTMVRKVAGGISLAMLLVCVGLLVLRKKLN